MPPSPSASTSSDNVELMEDCPICLDPMKDSDHRHPLQCTRRCGYNFCLTCIESLITSSKDDYMEASDGNMHVKVFLHCPNCRSDLSPTIRETVLLRKVDFLLTDGRDWADVELTASQLRMMVVAMEDIEVKSAIEDARRREEAFFGGENPNNKEPEREDDDGNAEKEWREEDWGVEADLINGVHRSFRYPRGQHYLHKAFDAMEEAEQDHEECGVEADLVNGVHKSFRFPNDKTIMEEEKKADEKKKSPPNKIDITLFGGLEYAMSEDEQRFVTILMTSGDPDKLAAAAQVMHGISELSRRGVTPTRRLGLAKRSSVYELIDDARKAHRCAESKADGNNRFSPLIGRGRKQAPAADTAAAQKTDAATNGTHNNKGPSTAAANRTAQVLAAKNEVKRQAAYMRLYPLPVRMPKYVELDLSDPLTSRKFPLTFCDDLWDGTVMDAFSKITIGRKNRVIKKRTEHRGVRNVLGAGEGSKNGNYDVHIDVERPRVLVASVKSEGGKRGIMKGDVVTHLNGVEFKGSSEDLISSIRKCAERNDEKTFTLVLNAERSTAEALRRRALIIG